MSVKKHLVGGTIRKVMVQEIKRVYAASHGNVDAAAVTLGITPRTLRLWFQRWDELKGTNGMQRVLETTKAAGKKKPVKKKKKKMMGECRSSTQAA